MYNGKIATPQSLLSRKPPVTSEPKRSSSWAPRDATIEGSTNVSPMIEETEFPEKSAAGKAKRYTFQQLATKTVWLEWRIGAIPVL